MRPRRTRGPRPALGLSAAALLALAPAVESRAQTTVADEGALFLLLPVGARSVSMGQAVVADRGGSEAIWWNPSAVARADKREAAIHHSQSVIGTGDVVTFLIPSKLLGVLAASVNILDVGEQEIVLPGDDTPVGTILPRSFIFAATYATTIGRYISAGLTYKVLNFRVDCTGPCPTDPTLSASTTALDLGAQFEVPRKAPIVVGVAVRNIGPRLQVNDNPQSDPLPKRLQVGVQYRLTVPEHLARDIEVKAEVDAIDEISFGDPSARVGADIAWQQRAHFRAGYYFESADGPASATVGLGLAFGRLNIDIGRILSGLSADAGQAPTYLSLRFRF